MTKLNQCHIQKRIDLIIRKVQNSPKNKPEFENFIKI